MGEVLHGVELYAGLHSPGPRYELPSLCFDKAYQPPKTGKPTWGPAPQHPAQKLARARIDEVRFVGKHHMREFQGHYSPGPQYQIPGLTGGAPGNAFASTKQLQALGTKQAPARRSLSATQLGADPLFCVTAGSFADLARASEPTKPGQIGSEYWRRATHLQPSDMHRSTVDPRSGAPRTVTMDKTPWAEAARGPSLFGDRVQAAARRNAEERYRRIDAVPYRQLVDYMADPPLANVFGGLAVHDDFGATGGLNSSWRESKVVGNATVGARFGPPPKGGKLRYAHVQPMGINAVPRSAAHADVDGGRITKYKINRPLSAYSSIEQDTVSDWRVATGWISEEGVQSPSTRSADPAQSIASEQPATPVFTAQ